MAPGRRKPVQQPLFVATADLNVRCHSFYEAVNTVLEAHHFDAFAEGLCARLYDDDRVAGRIDEDLVAEAVMEKGYHRPTSTA